MTTKRRILNPGDEVVLIYDINVGFIQQSATFKEYRIIEYNNVTHSIPVFTRLNSEITGLECFWLLESEADVIRIEQAQKELIGLQIKALEIAAAEGIKVPEKIQDREIKEMADRSSEFRQALVNKMGYDPLDYSWVEKELADNSLEQKWFQFQRENGGSFDSKWREHTAAFNKKFDDNILPSEAFQMAKKWKRYIIGAWNTIRAQNPDMEAWKAAARKFEKFHREREERMDKWSLAHKDNFPLAKVKDPVEFHPGPYFNECIERIPKLFVNSVCSLLKVGVVLRVVGYDPEEKYISLDFTEDICNLIRPGIPDVKVNEVFGANYVISVAPEQIDEKLEILGTLELHTTGQDKKEISNL